MMMPYQPSEAEIEATKRDIAALMHKTSGAPDLFKSRVAFYVLRRIHAA